MAQGLQADALRAAALGVPGRTATGRSSVGPDVDVVLLELDPGLAFGTGTHATTALCLEWLDSGAAPGA